MTLNQHLTDTIALDIVGGYQEGKRYFEGDGTGTPKRIFDYNFSDHIRQRSLEARVSQHDAGPIGWVAGAYYLHDRVDFLTDLLAADVVASNLRTDYRQVRTSKAVFGQVDWTIVPRLILSGGLRHTGDDAHYRGATTDLNPFGVSTARRIAPALPVVFDNRFSDSNPSGRATLSYRPTEQSNIYVSYGTGYKSGGFDGSSIFSTPEAFPFKSEDVRAIKGGFKLSGAHGLFLNVDGYHYRFDNLQANTTQILAGQTTAANVRTNVAKARVYGADVQFGATLISSGPHRLTIDGGVTFINSRILDYRSSNPALVAINLGNDLPAAPHFSGNGEVRYYYTSAQGWTLGAAVDVRHKSSEYKRLDNNAGSLAPAYDLLNARIDLTLAHPAITLFVYGRNLTDTVYFTDLTSTFRLAGTPRTFGAGARFSF